MAQDRDSSRNHQKSSLNQDISPSTLQVEDLLSDDGDGSATGLKLMTRRYSNSVVQSRKSSAKALSVVGERSRLKP